MTSLGRLFDACKKNPYFGLTELFATAANAPDAIGYIPPAPVGTGDGNAATGETMSLPDVDAGVVISDTYLLEVPTPATVAGSTNATAVRAALFVKMLSAIIALVEPTEVVEIKDWDDIAEQTATILATNTGALTSINGKDYLRAYVNDPRGDPAGSAAAGYSAELVTQLETLEPILRWEAARNKTTLLSAMLIAGLPDNLWFHPEIGTVVDRPDRTRLTFNDTTAEECRSTAGRSANELRYCADSWYIYYPYVKLGDMATHPASAARLPWAEQALKQSIDFGIRFGRSQNYTFPILSSYVEPFVPPPCGGLPGCGREFDVGYTYVASVPSAHPTRLRLLAHPAGIPSQHAIRHT